MVSSLLEIDDLFAGTQGRTILHGLSLAVGPGEIHAVMGPNGSGKSTLAHVLSGKPGYRVTGGSVRFGGEDLLALPAHERARRGLFVACQYPAEVPGVPLRDLLSEAAAARGLGPERVGGEELDAAAGRLGLDGLLDRAVNEGLSGGEKKRNETLQLSLLDPRLGVLDEIDSGLDVDGVRLVAREVLRQVESEGLGVLVITHYRRILEHLPPHLVHVLVEGRIVRSGGPELAEELERTGYDVFRSETPPEDPFAL